MEVAMSKNMQTVLKMWCVKREARAQSMGALRARPRAPRARPSYDAEAWAAFRRKETKETPPDGDFHFVPSSEGYV